MKPCETCNFTDVKPDVKWCLKCGSLEQVIDGNIVLWIPHILEAEGDEPEEGGEIRTGPILDSSGNLTVYEVDKGEEL